MMQFNSIFVMGLLETRFLAEDLSPISHPRLTPIYMFEGTPCIKIPDIQEGQPGYQCQACNNSARAEFQRSNSSGISTLSHFNFPGRSIQPTFILESNGERGKQSHDESYVLFKSLRRKEQRGIIDRENRKNILSFQTTLPSDPAKIRPKPFLTTDATLRHPDNDLDPQAHSFANATSDTSFTNPSYHRINTDFSTPSSSQKF